MSNYTNRVKYPRTFHFDNSPGLQNDDRRLQTLDGFYKNGLRISPKQVVATLKMDGENTTMYSDHIHARSLDSPGHSSRNIVKAIHGRIKHEIPDGYRICGENLYAKHSIYYQDLVSYFQVFNVWDHDWCLDWEETKEICELLGLHMVQVIYEGPFDLEAIHNAYLPYAEQHEGYVVRVRDKFHIDKFSTHVGKYVRKDHVQTSTHWLREQIVPNQLGE